MPIYEYECKACQHHLEILQKASDALLTKCPQCGKKKLVRLVSATSFQLKGEGWYVTDFRDKSKKGPAKQEEGKEQSKKDQSQEKATKKEEKASTSKTKVSTTDKSS